MKKLTLQKKTYTLEQTAHTQLEQYLDSVRTHFADETEVILDIELACAEILDGLLLDRTDKTLTESDVTVLIQKLGTVAMITSQSEAEEVMVTGKKLYRDTERRWLGGVSAGLAAYFSIPAWTVRVAFIIALIAPIPSVIPYLILWFVLPPTKTKSDQLRMRGVPVSLNTLSNTEGYTRKRVITLAKVAAILIGLISLLGAALLTTMIFFMLTAEQADQLATANMNLYEYQCESGDGVRLLQAENGGGSVMIVGDKEGMHQGEYALLYDNETEWVYETPTALELMQSDDMWQFALNKNNLNLTALNRDTEERDSCVVVTMRASAQNQPSALERIADFSEIDSCLDAGNVWDASERRCLGQTE